MAGSSRAAVLFRSIEILKTIPVKPRYITATTIGSKLEEKGFKISRRMLERDLAFLATHFNLVSDKRSIPFKWSFESKGIVDFEVMDMPTALAWVLARDNLRELLPKLVMDQLNKPFDKAQRFIDTFEHNSLLDWTERVVELPNGKSLIAAKYDDDLWWELSQAVLEGYALDVTYKKRGEEKEKSYTIHPYGMIIRHTVNYLIASVKDYENLTHFAFHRFTKVKKSKVLYRERPDFNIHKHIQDSQFGVQVFQQDSRFVYLTARISSDLSDTLLETPLATDQIIESNSEANALTLRATVPNDQQTFMWILSHGSQVDVIEPLEWREKIHEHARGILASKL